MKIINKSKLFTLTLGLIFISALQSFTVNNSKENKENSEIISVEKQKEIIMSIITTETKNQMISFGNLIMLYTDNTNEPVLIQSWPPAYCVQHFLPYIVLDVSNPDHENAFNAYACGEGAKYYKYLSNPHTYYSTGCP